MTTAADNQGAVYAQLIADELNGWRQSRASSVESLARIQQSAALPISLIAVLASLSRFDGLSGPTWAIIIGSALLVIAVLCATVGLTANRSKLVNPDVVMKVVNAGWQDDETDARHNAITYRVEQMQDLKKVCARLYKWRVAAIWCQSSGLVVILLGGSLFLA